MDSDGNVIYNANGNVKTTGYIPGIKIFRLEGIDGIRGFSDEEINRVESGADISDIIIQDKAYFINCKFESRYTFGDNLIFALFFDAGRVYVEHLKPLKLRTSIGGSFKFLTPVGTLDLDYGIKLSREINASGQRERFGRFHLTIGSF